MLLRDLYPGDRFRLTAIPDRCGEVRLQGPGGTVVRYDPVTRQTGTGPTTLPAETVQISAGTEVEYIPEGRRIFGHIVPITNGKKVTI